MGISLNWEVGFKRIFRLHATFSEAAKYIEKQESIMQPISKALLLTLIGAFVGAAALPSNAQIFEYPIDRDAEEIEVDTGIEFTVTCSRARTGDAADSGIIRIDAEDEDEFDLDISSSEISLSRNTPFNSWFRKSHDVSAELILSYSPEGIEVSSAAEGRISECFSNNEELELKASSGGSLRIRGDGGEIEDLDIDVSSGGSIRVKAPLNFSKAAIEASSGAQIDFDDDVTIDEAGLRISSGASVELCGAKSITGRISSGGNAEVPDDIKREDFKTSSGGSADSFHC